MLPQEADGEGLSPRIQALKERVEGPGSSSALPPRIQELRARSEAPPEVDPAEIQARQERRRLRRRLGVDAPERTFGDAFSEVYEKPQSIVPFVGGLMDAEDARQLWLAAKRVEEGGTDPADVDALMSFLEERRRPQTFGYTFASILTRLPTFAAEFGLTGGAYTAGSAASRKLLGKVFRESVEGAVEGVALRATRKALEFAGGVTAQTAALGLASGAIPRATYEEALPEMQISTDGSELVLTQSSESFWEALPAGIKDSFIEVLTERSGGAITAGLAKLGIKDLQQRVLREYLRIKPGRATDVVERLAQRAGWNGVLEELGEERLGEILRGRMPSTPFTEEGRKQLAAEALAFGVFGGGMAAAGMLGGQQAEAAPEINRGLVEETGSGPEPNIPTEAPQEEAPVPAESLEETAEGEAPSFSEEEVQVAQGFWQREGATAETVAGDLVELLGAPPEGAMALAEASAPAGEVSPESSQQEAPERAIPPAGAAAEGAVPVGETPGPPSRTAAPSAEPAEGPAVSAAEAQPQEESTRQLQQAAQDVPEELRFGEKAYIVDVYDAYRKQGGTGSYQDFKDRLVEASKTGEVSLSRADLRPAEDAERVRLSTIQRGAAEFQFVRVPESVGAPPTTADIPRQPPTETAAPLAQGSEMRGLGPQDLDVWKGVSKSDPGRALQAQGRGRYFGLDRETSARFSESPRRQSVRLDNPVRVTSDQELADLKRSLENYPGELLNPNNRSYVNLAREQWDQFANRMLDRGFDGMIVDYAEAYGGRQLVVFERTAEPQAETAGIPIPEAAQPGAQRPERPVEGRSVDLVGRTPEEKAAERDARLDIYNAALVYAKARGSRGTAPHNSALANAGLTEMGLARARGARGAEAVPDEGVTAPAPGFRSEGSVEELREQLREAGQKLALVQAAQPGAQAETSGISTLRPSQGEKEWFGPESKDDLRNDDGEALVLYHGSPAGALEDFRPSSGGAAGPGVYLALSLRKAQTFAGPDGGVSRVFARGRYRRTSNLVDARRIAQEARESGYDGLFIQGPGEVLVFDPRNIRIAEAGAGPQAPQPGIPIPEAAQPGAQRPERPAETVPSTVSDFPDLSRAQAKFMTGPVDQGTEIEGWELYYDQTPEQRAEILPVMTRQSYRTGDERSTRRARGWLEALNRARTSAAQPGAQAQERPELESLTYRELQDRAKALGIKANQKAEALREAIARAEAGSTTAERAEESEGVSPGAVAGAPETLEGVPTAARSGPPGSVATPIGGALEGRLEAPAEPVRGRPVSRPQVIEALAGILRASGSLAPIRWGRTGGAAGIFKIQPEVIRVKTANSITSSAHEVAHALEKAWFGWDKGGPWKEPVASRKMQRELESMGRALYEDATPAAGDRREGWAEFVRVWITESAGPQASGNPSKLAPETAKWFQRWRDENPGVARAFDEARALTRRYRAQGSKARLDSNVIDPTSLRERAKRARERFSTESFVTMFIEAAEPVRRLTEAAKARGAKLLPEEDPFLTLSALRTNHVARTKEMVETGMIDLAGNRVGPSLAQALAPVKGRYRDFVLYLYARRAKALWEDPRKPEGRNPGISLEDANQVLEDLGTPQFETAAQGVYEWSDGVLNYAAQASPTFAQVVDRIREVDPGAYIPLQREFNELDELMGKGGPVGVASGSVTKRLRGSGRRIKDPIPQLISNAQATVLGAHRRLVLDQVLALSETEGMGHLIEEVEIDRVPVASRKVGELLSEVKKKLGAEIEVTEEMEEALNETVTLYAPAQSPRDPQITPIVRDGVVRWYQLDPKLQTALVSMDPYRLPRALYPWLGLPAELFRMGTTGLRASFALVTNPKRDFQTFYLNSAYNQNAVRQFFEFMRALKNGALAKVTGGAVRDPYLDAFIRMGGEMSQPFGQDIQYTARSARRLTQTRVVRVLDVRNAFDFIRELLQFPESAARVSELKAAAASVGWKPGQPMSLGQSLQMMLPAKQVTTDFTAAGTFARMWNRIAPFHNAAIQGPRANLRALRRNPRRFILRGMAMSAATLALWWSYRDEEWYTELSAKAKALFWHIPIDWPEPTLVRIPRAFEPGMVFAALPELMADAAYRQQPEAMTEWFEQFIDVATPNMMPVLAGEALEQAANQDFFWDMPIVPRREENRPAEEQFGDFTSTVAIELGEMFGWSPRRIDHAIRGIGGGVAADVVSLLGRGERGDAPMEIEKELSDIPVFGRLFQRGGKFGSRPQSLEKFYDELEEATKKQYSVRYQETEQDREIRLMLTDASRALSALGYVRTQVAGQDARRRIRLVMMRHARKALEMAEAGQVDRTYFRDYRKAADELREAAEASR